PAAIGAASTRTFFTHWRGRAALIRPPTKVLGGPLTSASARSTPVGSSLISGSAFSSRAFSSCTVTVESLFGGEQDGGGRGAERGTGDHIGGVMHPENDPGQQHRRYEHRWQG